MTAPAPIDMCTSCAKGPRRIDPDTGACKPCLARHQNLVEFFRLVRTDPSFSSRARRDLHSSKRKTFDTMFGIDEQPPIYTGEMVPLKDDDAKEPPR